MTANTPDERISRGGWARAQLLAAVLCFIPLVGYAHMYVAHESDDVTITRWAMYALVLSLIWGPALIGIAGGLGFSPRPRKLGLILGGLGGLVAAVFYLGGLWVFTFR